MCVYELPRVKTRGVLCSLRFELQPQLRRVANISCNPPRMKGNFQFPLISPSEQMICTPVLKHGELNHGFLRRKLLDLCLEHLLSIESWHKQFLPSVHIYLGGLS